MKKRFLACFMLVSLLFSTVSFTTLLATEETGTGTNTEETTGSGENNEETPDTGNTDDTGTQTGDDTPTTTPDPDEGEDEEPEEATCTARDFSIEMNKNTILTSTLKGSSTIEDATLKYIIVENPTHGTLVHSNEESADFTYTPELDYVGKDTFTFKVNDGSTDSNIATAEISVTAPTENIIPFTYMDMQSHWANYSASHLAARGIIIGEEIGSRFYFYPDRTMTRADFMLFLLALTESNLDARVETSDITFADADKTPDWLVEAAKLAYSKGIIKGSPEGNSIYLNAFSPLTKTEAAIMVNNVLKVSDTSKDLNYKDLKSIPNWALPAVMNLTAYGIVQGNDLNEFSPNKVITRAEGAELCYKLIKQIESNSLTDIK